mgnify:CR=1 FL=1
MARPVHFEIHGEDPEKANAFYSGLFGWKVDQWGGQQYWLYDTGEGPGIHGAGAPVQEHGQRVVLTMDVDDIDSYAAKIPELGGTIVQEKAPIPGVGWLVQALDPNGVLFGVMQSDENAGT